MFAPPQKSQLDPLDELIKTNAERGRRGLKPMLPAWFINGGNGDG